MYSLLLKFRVHPIVLTADIEKAYLQININEEHRDYLRFLWYLNLHEESKYENIDPEFTRKVKKHFYVDDLNSVAQSAKEGF